MTLALTPAGLLTQTQAEIVEELTAKIRATFGNNTNTSTSSIMGQLVNIVAEFRALDQQVLLAVYRSFDPNSAVGVALDRLANLTGSVRKGATSSTVDVIFEFSGAGVVNNGDLFQNDDNGSQWQVINGPYTDTGGPYPEDVAGQLQAVDTGPILANAGTNWSLVTANPALNGVTNPADDADLGRDLETDPDFRVRRQTELFARNLGPLAAIRGVVSKVEGVETVRVYHNPATAPVDSDGIPFKAFNVLVETNPSPPGVALQQRIADAIWSATGAGGEAFGTDYNLTVIDDEGQPQDDIRFDLVDEVEIYVNVAIDTTGTEQAVSTNMVDVVEAAILERAQTEFNGIGQNQLTFQYSAIVSELQASGEISGAVFVTVTLSRVSQLGPFADPVEIGIRERPIFDSPRIVVTVTP
jgi:uncharacterized phage protein gp47/JayE